MTSSGLFLVLILTGAGGIVYGVSTNGKAGGLGLGAFTAGLTALCLWLMGVR